MKQYKTPVIKTLKADEILEAMGPAQGYGGTGGPGGLIEPLATAGGMGSPSHFNRN